MREILDELTRRNLPYTVTARENGSVILYAMGYAPFLYRENEFEVDAFYLTSNEVYALSRELAKLSEKAVSSPLLNYKQIAERSGLGFRGENDLIFSPEFGSLTALGAIFVEGESYQEHRKLEISCKKCGVCVSKCPTGAIRGGFNRPSCIREQMDSGIKEETIPLLGKSVLGCNICSLNCPLNKVEFIRPPEDFARFLEGDNFFDKCIKGKREMKILGDYIGVNYVRPAKLLTLAVYSINNVECDRKRWLDALSDYPDERVRRAVSLMQPFVKE